MTHRQVAYCVGCGTLGWQARQLGPYERDGCPTPRLRVCPPCGDRGWSLAAEYVARAAEAAPLRLVGAA